MLEIIGHAIVSTDGMIADAAGRMPPGLRSPADWRRFQAALDAAALVVVGRVGHEAHPNPGRRRLVVTGRIGGLAPDPSDSGATLWNPGAVTFADVVEQLGIEGTAAVTGGTRVFDLFLPMFTRFDLVTVKGLDIPGGRPCFSAGPPEQVLAKAGLVADAAEELEPRVWLRVWRR